MSRSGTRLFSEVRCSAIEELRNLELEKYDAEYFRLEYWKEDIPGKSGNRGLSYDDIGHGNRFDYLVETIRGRFGPLPLYDMGCGLGHFVSRWNEFGNATGFDGSAAARDIGLMMHPELSPDKLVVRALHEDFSEYGALDLVICTDVLEHLIVFDIEKAIQNICALASRRIIASINLDNPYAYHPTILSAESWVTLFESVGNVRYGAGISRELSSEVKERYAEYDFFVFDVP